MNWKTYLLRLAGFFIITACGWYLYPFVFHGMISLGMMPEGDDSAGYGKILTAQVVYVLMASALASLISIFIKGIWRHVLYFSPLYAPALFAIFYTAFRG